MKCVIGRILVVIAAAMHAAALDAGAESPIRLGGGGAGEPINEFIYGQFIEHAGRCIYGGIWAEMLEDRKFYHPVDEDASPWEEVGADVSGYARVSVNSFVGELTPMVRLPGGKRRGLVQEGLPLEEGRGYEGRVWLAGNTGGAPIEVSLVWGDGEDERETVTVDRLSREYEKTSFAFTAQGSAPDGRIEIMSEGEGHFSVGTISLMPDDNIKGLRADTLELLKELNAPMYRWPGGNFVSGYDWRDGVGDRDRRPPRRNPAWEEGVESNDFGLDEFIAFCRRLDAEPHIVVNTGAGDVDMALEQLEYCNGPADSPMGQQRAANGHEAPHDVTWWGVGNEMYGGWQIGYIPLEDYLERHNVFAAAMREAYPDIKLTASGQMGEWSEGLLRHCADHMDFIGEHFYAQEQQDVAAHVRQIPDRIRRTAEAHRRYRQEIEGLAEKEIPIALTEWNYWYGPYVYGELGTQYYQKDALGIAAGIHEMARQSDIIQMASYAQAVNVLGAIKTSDTDAVMDATGAVLTLYRRYFGALPVMVSVEEPLDAMGAWTEDRATLTLGVVNPTASSYTIPIVSRDAAITGTAEGWTVAHDDPLAHNVPGEPQQVRIEAIGSIAVEDGLPVAPYSATVFHVKVE